MRILVVSFLLLFVFACTESLPNSSVAVRDTLSVRSDGVVATPPLGNWSAEQTIATSIDTHLLQPLQSVIRNFQVFNTIPGLLRFTSERGVVGDPLNPLLQYQWLLRQEASQWVLDAPVDPASSSAMTPYDVVVLADGTLVASWMSGNQLFFSDKRSAIWSEPQSIAAGVDRYRIFSAGNSVVIFWASVGISGTTVTAQAIVDGVLVSPPTPVTIISDDSEALVSDGASSFLLSFINQVAGSVLLLHYDLSGVWQNPFEIPLPPELSSNAQLTSVDVSFISNGNAFVLVKSTGSNQVLSSEVDFVSQPIWERVNQPTTANIFNRHVCIVPQADMVNVFWLEPVQTDPILLPAFYLHQRTWLSGGGWQPASHLGTPLFGQVNEMACSTNDLQQTQIATIVGTEGGKRIFAGGFSPSNGFTSEMTNVVGVSSTSGFIESLGSAVDVNGLSTLTWLRVNFHGPPASSVMTSSLQ